MVKAPIFINDKNNRQSIISQDKKRTNIQKVFNLHNKDKQNFSCTKKTNKLHIKNTKQTKNAYILHKNAKKLAHTKKISYLCIDKNAQKEDLMNTTDIKNLIRYGETSKVQFKRELSSTKQIAAEIIAFANSKGGILIFGIEDKTGDIIGLNYDAIQTTSREIGNAANDMIRPVVYVETEVVEIDNKALLIVYINEGNNKPYKDLNGNIWVKQGADKRHITENVEILNLFSQSLNYAPDEAPVPRSSLSDLTDWSIDNYFSRVYNKKRDEFGIPNEQLLNNLRISDNSNRLTLAGLLFFGYMPQRFYPSFMIKAVSFFGNSIAGTNYRNSKDIEGTIPQMFTTAMSFLEANLFSLQDGQSFNSIGRLEISKIVLEELLQNALVHRDYLRTAPIRLLIFDNRVEIINPGSLTAGLTVNDIKMGTSFQRNQLIANFCAKTMTYRGLGSGIIRALKEDNQIDFFNNEQINEFKVVIWRSKKLRDIDNIDVNNYIVAYEPYAPYLKTPNQNYPQNTTTKNKLSKPDIIKENILASIRKNGYISTTEIARNLNISLRSVAYYIKDLKGEGKLLRIGGKKGGFWQCVD